MIRYRYAKGQIVLLALVFAGIFTVVATTLAGYVTNYSRFERTAVAAAQALAIAEGALEEGVYQLNQDPAYSGATAVPLGNGVFTIAITPVGSETKRVVATGYVPNQTAPIATKVVTADIGINNTVIAFRYGIQAGRGGFYMYNSSKIIGNVFSSGPVVGSGNYIYGDVISSGASGRVYGIHATSSVYAHRIGDDDVATIIDKDAYYATSIERTTVSGTSYPGSTDIPDAPLPISEAQITQWEEDAAAGGTISSCDSNGNYVVSGDLTIGPKKIACNLVVKSSSGVLNVTGPIWVTGNITTQTGPTIQMDPSLGSQNVAIIADNPANRSGSGMITVGQSTIFRGSGAPGSFVFLISQNDSAEVGGNTVALSLNQGASALVAYALHGLVSLAQSVNVKEATGYKIALSNSAAVTYDTGLPNTVFEAGPGASWCYVPGTYSIAR